MRTKVVATLLIVGGILIPWITRPSGRAMLEIRDVTRTAEARANAPWFPFRNGALHVTVEGRMDGNGRLHIYFNRDRDHARIDLEKGKISEHFRADEAWVDDLRVVFVPMGAKQGELRITLLCGRNPKAGAF